MTAKASEAMPVTLNVNRVCLAAHPEPHRRVHTIHGCTGDLEWQHTQRQAIEYLEAGMFAYYLQHGTRAVPLVVGRTATGEKFLKAAPDGETPALLLQLLAATPTGHQFRLP